MTAITWRRDKEAGEWAATAGDRKIATAAVRPGVSAGYWNRYEGRIYGRREYAATLGEFKQMTADAYAARQGN